MILGILGVILIVLSYLFYLYSEILFLTINIFGTFILIIDSLSLIAEPIFIANVLILILLIVKLITVVINEKKK